MKNYKTLMLKWIVIGSLLILATLLPSVLLISREKAQSVSIGYGVSALVIFLFGWGHFRIETYQIAKGKKLFNDNEMEYYIIDKNAEKTQKTVRIKKFLVFLATILIYLSLISLIAIYAFA